MRRIYFSVVILCLWAPLAAAQQTIYWKKDHIYGSPGGGKVATATPLPSDQTAPSAPTSLSYSNETATSVQLSWTGSTDTGGSGLAGYKIYRGPVPVGTTTSTSYTDEGLVPSTAYSYTVRAFDNDQNHSAAGNTASPTTSSSSGDVTNPDPPANLEGRGVDSQPDYEVQLDWNPATDSGGSGVIGYEVYRDGVLISGGTPITTLSYEDITSSANTSFTYTVKSVDGEGNTSAASDSVAVTTLRKLIFFDDYNRADGPATGSWEVVSQTFVYVGSGTDSWYATQSQTGISDFRASVRVLSHPSSFEPGIAFWRASSSKIYRAIVEGYRITLHYQYSSDPDDTDSLAWVNNVTGGPGAGTLMVEGDSSTRNIKVYWNGTLVIDFTETDTSRPNVGRLRLTAYMDSLNYGPAMFDDFKVEE